MSEGELPRPPETPGGTDFGRLEAALGEALLALGLGPQSAPGMHKTPERTAKALDSFFSGLRTDPEAYLEETFPGGTGDPVVLRDIPLYSMCEHHLVPFVGRAHVGYVPDGRVLGLSEIAGVVEAYARRPQLQERLTAQVADLLFEPLGSKGSFVVIEAEQLCMTMRGAQKPGTLTVTRAARGVYAQDASLREEFTRLLGR